MASPPDQIAEQPADVQSRGWRFALGRAGLLLVVLMLIGVVIGWTQRENIARDLIGEQLDALGIPASYEVDINTNRQVLTDIVVGDPNRPDLTIERAEVELIYGFGIPEIGRITLHKPRLFGSYRGGVLSFGALNPALFSEGDEKPAGLPEIDLKIIDGRALLESDYGPLGVKLEGDGRLDSGFSGTLAAIGPKLEFGQCRLDRASVYGKIATSGGALSLDGPIRISRLGCADAGVAVEKLAWPARMNLSSDFASVKIDGDVSSGKLTTDLASAASLAGPVAIAYRDGDIDGNVDLALSQIRSDQFTARGMGLIGAIRSADNFAQLEIDSDISGNGISIGKAVPDRLQALAKSAKGTLLAPLLEKFSGAVTSEIRGASLSASLIGRSNGSMQALVMPEGALRNASGGQLLSLSRVQYRQQGSRTPLISGNLRVGGQNLPRLIGRMESNSSGGALFRLKMQPYSARDSSMSIPEMLVTQSRSGALTFAGAVTASGPLPGGQARGLRVPINGVWDKLGGLTLWRSCTNVGFDSLAFANLELNNRSITLCPPSGRPIVRQQGGALSIAAGLPSLDVAGSLAGTPITIRSGPIGFAYPGVAKAQQLRIELGPRDEPSTVVISDLSANLGEGINGTFSGADMGLAAVPLDLMQTEGDWSYEKGVLRIDNAQFTMQDRADPDRFEPLPVRDGVLVLEDNIVAASASVRAPTTDREVARVTMTHNLGTGTGFANLAVGGLKFDDGLQPTDLTKLALGVVANVEGIVTGLGRIDWNSETVTSSGAFSSESLDLAAAFGPVKGASGTVEFVDLLSLTTAPNQIIKVASINPGIEAKNGEIGFRLREGQFLGVTGGSWPFMGGTLTLKPVDLNLGIEEKRRYVLQVEGLDAALFIENLELGNISASGTFDGALPLIFDEAGFGRIEDGLIVSRAPGGNVSYVGDLTYEDMSPIVNYTFQTLRSLDYNSLIIEMEGPLTGDILTQLKFGQVKQGAGTKQNFITRQIADLPIQLNVNIRAPFYSLATTLKSIYDPSAVRDPRELGLLVDDGTRFVPANEGSAIKPLPPPVPPEIPIPGIAAIIPDEASIQTLESEELP